MGLGYSGGSAATDLFTELVTCPIETENDGAAIPGIGFRWFRIDFR